MSVLAPVVLGLPLCRHLVRALVVTSPVQVSRPLTLLVSVSLSVKIQSLPCTLVSVSMSFPVQVQSPAFAVAIVLASPVLLSLSSFPIQG